MYSAVFCCVLRHTRALLALVARSPPLGPSPDPAPQLARGRGERVGSCRNCLLITSPPLRRPKANGAGGRSPPADVRRGDQDTHTNRHAPTWRYENPGTRCPPVPSALPPSSSVSLSHSSSVVGGWVREDVKGGTTNRLRSERCRRAKPPCTRSPKRPGRSGVEGEQAGTDRPGCKEEASC